MKRSLLLLLVLCLSALPLSAQRAEDKYQMPPKEIADLVDAPSIPLVNISPDDKRLLLMEPPPLLTIDDLAQPELKLAGLRFNPKTHDQPRATYFKKLTFVTVADGATVQVTGLPEWPRIKHVTWSPDGQRIAFTLSTPNGVEIWTAGVDGAARKLSGFRVNDTFGGSPLAWVSDSRTLIARIDIPGDRETPPSSDAVATGPVMQETAGRKSAARTYEDLLKSANDADVFAWHAASGIARISIDGTATELPIPGQKTSSGEQRLIIDAEPSPDGKYLLVQSIHRPFSYLVPAFRFPTSIEVFTIDGRFLREVADLPLAEDVPVDFDAVRTGVRSAEWRADKPATLFWVEAQDRGNPRLDVPVRDKLFTLDAPFEGQPVTLASLPMRYRGIQWSSDNLALVWMGRWKDRKTVTVALKPGQPDAASRTIFDRSSEDRYGDPGRPMMRNTPAGTNVLRTANNGASIFLTGEGASSEGDRPFLDQLDLATLKTTRLFRSSGAMYEAPIEVLDDKGNTILTRRETVSDPPNVYLRDVRRKTSKAITKIANPMPQLASASKELIKYKRADGLDLSGTLYLPAGYDAKRDGRLPVLLWAYPQEFKSAAAASQVTGSPYRFTRATSGSPLFFLVRGYAVLDNPAIPIIGEGSKEPNDTYIEQLVAGAQAAVEELVRRGVGDRDRMAVGGHSYGAFMTANLLAHSDLFRAGIARSGAYNRTLTPFSFQAEERTFWQAADTYMNMSPFRYADKINEPILLIHGIDDDNTGTFPIQSERLYAALKGLGGTARLVMLPYEAHGYRARESVMHMLWEMDRWLDRYVKNAKPRVAEK